MESELVVSVGSVLNDPQQPIAERFRALFTLRGLGGKEAISQISSSFKDPSNLLKHECAYCLGQMQDPRAIPVLRSVLEDQSQHPIVRHEAAEALAAIGDTDQQDILTRYSSDAAQVVSDTCTIALAKLSWLANMAETNFIDNNPYSSVDPAPPLKDGNVGQWRVKLLDQSLSLFQRYQALFALRNHGGVDAVLAIVSAFSDNNVLFKHELAYVLGQMKDPASVDGLNMKLSDKSENAMVRHECAEALGAIATKECLSILTQYTSDDEVLVRESCEVALDMYQYEHANEFQYANTATKLLT